MVARRSTLVGIALAVLVVGALGMRAAGDTEGAGAGEPETGGILLSAQNPSQDLSLDYYYYEDPLGSFEDLLKRQAKLLRSFEDLLKSRWEELDDSVQLEFLRSFEDLLRSQAELLSSFEDVFMERIGALSSAKYVAYLQSFEELLKLQADLLASFEYLLKMLSGVPVEQSVGERPGDVPLEATGPSAKTVAGQRSIC